MSENRCKRFKKISKWFKNYFYNILLWLDEGVNVFFVPIFRIIVKLPPAAGNAHYTVSQTCAEMRERGSIPGCVLCKLLTWIFKRIPPKKKKNYDHCRNAMLNVPEDEDAG